jgi:hypothetical protein
MNIIPYKFEKHSMMLATMLAKREMPPELIFDTPEYGWVAFEGEAAIAFGFIRRIEGPYVMFDSLITDISVPAELRDKALDRLVAKLIRVAQANKINKILAFTADKNTFMRSQKHGFVALPHEFAVLSFPIIPGQGM